MKYEKKSKARSAGLYVACGVAMIVCLGCIAWFVNLMVLRASFKSDRLELAASFTKASYAKAELEYEGQTLEADQAALDNYLGFLTHNQTMVLRRGGQAPGAGTLYLHLPDTMVCFTPDENGLDTCVQWELNGKRYRYTLRGVTDFEHLTRYLVNVKNRAEQNGS